MMVNHNQLIFPFKHIRSWTPAIQSLCDVVWIRGAALRRACYALLSVWCAGGKTEVKSDGNLTKSCSDFFGGGNP